MRILSARSNFRSFIIKAGARSLKARDHFTKTLRENKSIELYRT
jgi:hypothetical protein